VSLYLNSWNKADISFFFRFYSDRHNIICIQAVDSFDKLKRIFPGVNVQMEELSLVFYLKIIESKYTKELKPQFHKKEDLISI